MGESSVVCDFVTVEVNGIRVADIDVPRLADRLAAVGRAPPHANLHFARPITEKFHSNFLACTHFAAQPVLALPITLVHLER